MQMGIFRMSLSLLIVDRLSYPLSQPILEVTHLPCLCCAIRIGSHGEEDVTRFAGFEPGVDKRKLQVVVVMQGAHSHLSSTTIYPAN